MLSTSHAINYILVFNVTLRLFNDNLGLSNDTLGLESSSCFSSGTRHDYAITKGNPAVWTQIGLTSMMCWLWSFCLESTSDQLLEQVTILVFPVWI
jgi:hypothetical protein